MVDEIKSKGALPAFDTSTTLERIETKHACEPLDRLVPQQKCVDLNPTIHSLEIGIYGGRGNKAKELSKTRFEFDEGVRAEDKLWTFTRKLLAEGDHYAIDTNAGRVNLVIENGYLTPKERRTLAGRLARARVNLPKYWAGQGTDPAEITVYLFSESSSEWRPWSNSTSPGRVSGQPGLTLRWAKEGAAPIEHEMIHILRPKGSWSMSLTEGHAQYGQVKEYSERAVGFAEDGVDIEVVSLRLADTSPEVIDAIGTDLVVLFLTGPRQDDHGVHQTMRDHDGQITGRKVFYYLPARFDFLYASHSFVQFLIDEVGGGDIGRFVPVLTGGATDAAYLGAYGKDLKALKTDWLNALRSRTGHPPVGP